MSATAFFWAELGADGSCIYWLTCLLVDAYSLTDSHYYLPRLLRRSVCLQDRVEVIVHQDNGTTALVITLLGVLFGLPRACGFLPEIPGDAILD